MTSKQQSGVLIGGISGVIAIISALPVFDVDIGSIFVVLAFPGMLLSMAVSGNVHAFNRWLVVLFNWIIYAFIFIALRKVIRIFRGN
ncbi:MULTISPECIES: hypothetical protein [Acidobacteriaceae]|uniref:hypothetical protein n=1 Tax=Acidobacteriaceae TaxID=204434 RepID=UPI00131B2848|nr:MULTISPECIES: hypothetical protein [Acidobacteriaceae]MDW5266312.1 hypothetical protein [Edaphobacter sp.]